MTWNINDKHVLVTGGTSGIGRATAAQLASRGARVTITSRTLSTAQNAADELTAATGTQVEPAEVDLASLDAVRTFAASYADRHDRLDILINNAGIAPTPDPPKVERGIANQMARMEGRLADMVPPDTTVDLTDADWDRMIKVHLYGTFYGTRAALRHMTPARSGSIVNISSVLGLRPMAGSLHYAAAKAGIIAVTKSTGQEVAPFGVRVNAVCPGWIDTPLLAPMDPMMMAGITMQIPRGRMGTAEELAELVRFLSGPESSYCNGDVFAASGGFV